MNRTVISHKYFHIENGGPSFEVVVYTDEDGYSYSSIEMSDGYYDHTHHKFDITSPKVVTPKNLRELGYFFTKSADELEKEMEKRNKDIQY